MTAGYAVRDRDDSPLFVGTFNECAQWGTDHAPYGWTIRDARGLVVA